MMTYANDVIRLESGTQLVAAGFDDGSIKLFAATSSTIKLVYDLPAVLCHQLTVTCVRFRPQHKDAEDSSIQVCLFPCIYLYIYIVCVWFLYSFFLTVGKCCLFAIDLSIAHVYISVCV